LFKGPPFRIHWNDFGVDVLSVRDFIHNTNKDATFVGVGLSKGAAALAIAEVNIKTNTLTFSNVL
jgi:hypothetical protein